MRIWNENKYLKFIQILGVTAILVGIVGLIAIFTSHTNLNKFEATNDKVVIINIGDSTITVGVESFERGSDGSVIIHSTDGKKYMTHISNTLFIYEE